MAQKPEKRPSAQENQRKKDNAPMNRAMTFFIAGCLAEIYLLVVRRYYINGTLEQVVAWDNYIQVLALVGLGILAVGIGYDKKTKKHHCKIEVLSDGEY